MQRCIFSRHTFPFECTLQLQGKEKSVVDMVEKLGAFGNKLDLFHADLLSGRLLHLNTLKTVGVSKRHREYEEIHHTAEGEFLCQI